MITIVGLGSGDLDRLPDRALDILGDPTRTVVVRTAEHPAASQLSRRDGVISCDDLYESASSFEEVYDRIVDRIASLPGDVVYAVPGSPFVGEFVVRRLLESEMETELIDGVSFVEAILTEVGYDPLERGLSILNAHDLPEPLTLTTPTIIAQLDRPEVMADLSARLSRILPDDTSALVMIDVGTPSQKIVESPVASLEPSLASSTTSLYVDNAPGGLMGAILTMATLRQECPWDREQTRETLVPYLFEEAAELADAIAGIEDDEDWVGIGAVADELGDVLLQVLFQSVIAQERGEFDLDDVAEGLRQKLVRRHPHVFGDVVAEDATQVRTNWKKIKEDEKGGPSESILDRQSSQPSALSAARRIQDLLARVGFDWADTDGVRAKLTEELGELDAAETASDRESELGDVLFTVVNLSRHLDIDPDLSLRRAVERFATRVRRMEESGPLDGLTLNELNDRWERAKGQ